MFLSTWMIVTIIVAFGICAVYNRKIGFRTGGIETLKYLESKKFILVKEDGSIAKGME